MNNIDSQQHVSRIVEELKNDQAQRRRLLDSLAYIEKDSVDGDSLDNNQVSQFVEALLSLEMPLADANRVQYSLEELLHYDDRDFVHNAYRAILKRPPDAEGLASALAGLRSGELDRVEMLLELTSSLEAVAKGVRVTGLRYHRLARRLCQFPLLRYLANPIYGASQWRLQIRDQQRSLGRIFAHQKRLARFANYNLVVMQNALRLLAEQKLTLKESLERLAELSRHAAERLNEEAWVRQQQFNDRTAEIEDLRRVYNKYRTQVELTEKDLKREMDHLFRKHQEVKTELVYQSQRLASLERGVSSIPSQTALPRESERGAGRHALDPFFASFDEHFRGEREEVKKRLRAYLPLIREYGAGCDEAPILDVACGRGEWLEVLKEENLRATGVDNNRVLVDQCRERGLEVVQSDLIQHLHRSSESSLGAVSAFHIVEHLTIEDLIAFLDQTLRVLRAGGLLLLETPNPQNVLVGSCNFYFDPTHRHPLPTPVLRFLVESRGFVVVETFGLNPSDEKQVAGDSELVRRFNQYFYGPMDYCIAALKV